MREGQAPFDPQVIQTLAGNLGNKTLAIRFLSDYLDLLPKRKTRIIGTLREDDQEAAMDAVLSLKITSAMVGAHNVEDRCQVLQSLITQEDFEAARLQATALGTSIDALVSESPQILASFQHLAD